MTYLTASEPSLLDRKLSSTGQATRFWSRLMSITATAFNSLQRTQRPCIDRAVDDQRFCQQMRHEIMRHEARRLF